MVITLENLEKVALENNWKQFDLNDFTNIPSISGIYIYVNKVNCKIYIGQSKNIRQRTRDHFKIGRLKDHIVFDRAILKYGKSGFKFYIIEECPKEFLNDREIYYINKFEAFTKGYNMTKGGEGGSRSISEKQKQLVSKVMSKETWAYNFETKEFIVAESRLKLAFKLNKLYNCNITQSNISDAMMDSTSYSKCFIFADSKEALENKILTFNFPKKKTMIYLQNYKTKEIFGPVSIAEGEQIIKKYNRIASGHLHTAIKNNSAYIKDFIFADSLEALENKLNNLEVKIYAYDLSSKITYSAWSTSELKQLFEENELKFPSMFSYRKCIRNQQKQASGFIFDYSRKNLIKRVYAYYTESIKDIQSEILDLNLEHDQDIINTTDIINEISIAI